MPPMSPRYEHLPVGERVSALESTVADGSRNICEKLGRFETKQDAMDERLDRMEAKLDHQGGMNTVLVWVLDITKVALGGMMLWVFEHFSTFK